MQGICKACEAMAEKTPTCLCKKFMKTNGIEPRVPTVSCLPKKLDTPRESCGGDGGTCDYEPNYSRDLTDLGCPLCPRVYLLCSEHYENLKARGPLGSCGFHFEKVPTAFECANCKRCRFCSPSVDDRLCNECVPD